MDARPSASAGHASHTSAAGSGGGGGGAPYSPPKLSSDNPASPLLVVAGSTAPQSDADAGQTDPTADCGELTQLAEQRLGPADIIWIIDGSGSMADERAAVQANIAKFAQSIGQAGIDHHVVMLSPGDVAANTALGADPTHYLYVRAAVDSHNALSLLLDQFDAYASFLRAQATPHFVVVSDDDSSMKAADFMTQMQARLGKPFRFHAIASEDNHGLGCAGACGLPIICGASAPGRQYYALADATGGEKISICTADWSLVFGPLEQAVIESAPLPCEFALPTPPPGSSLDPDRVNVQVASSSSAPQTLPRAATGKDCGSQLAWYYDDPKQPSRITMCPGACDAVSGGGSVQIKLGCETVSLY